VAGELASNARRIRQQAEETWPAAWATLADKRGRRAIR
jgi:hypothetical protein